MKESSLFIILFIFIYAGMVQAENTSDTEASLRATEIQYSNEFKRKLVEKIENDPEYAGSYFSNAFKLLRAEKSVNLALLGLDSKIKAIENEMSVAISKAGRLPDDTPVFLSKNIDHKYYAINGRHIPLSEVTEIEPQRNIFSWEEYVALYEIRKKYLDNKAEVIEYRDQTLTPSRKKVPDPDILDLSKQNQKNWLDYKRKNL